MVPTRTPLLDQSPVPVDWPKRVGYPPPGITRMVAYPAGGPPDPDHPKRSVDAVYPHSAKKIAKAHAWMFPSKRIKLLGKKGKKRSRIFREAIESPHAGRPEEDTPIATTLSTHDLPDEVKHVTHQINKTGARALLVGGSVRDRLMGKPSKDFDVEVYGMHPDDLEHHLSKIGKVDKVGKSFGVLKLKHGNEDFDVSIPRRDQKTGKGTKGFMSTPDPTMTIGEAGRRRDFTMNSVAMDPTTGHVYDPHGGVQDIKDRVLRATDPSAFAEDPLRILRGAQFAARHRMTVHPDTMRLMQTASPELRELPKERVHAEWKKLLTKGEEPSRGLDVLHHSGALRELHPELHALHGAGALESTKRALDNAVSRTKGLQPNVREAIHHATLLQHTDAADPSKVSSEQLGAHKDAAAKVGNLVAERKSAVELYHKGDSATEGDIRRLAARLHPATISELTHVLHASHQDGESPAAHWLTNKAKEYGVHDGPIKPLLTGKHLAELGMKQGKEIGAIIRKVLELQLDGHVKTVDDAKAAARRLIADGGTKTLSASIDVSGPSLFERVFSEALDLIGALTASAKKKGPTHPQTLRYLKAATRLMREPGTLSSDEEKIVRRHLAASTSAQVDRDRRLLSTPIPFSQTASIDYDLKRALIEGLASVRKG